MLGACGAKLDVQENTIALQKSGKVLEAPVESFDQSYYDEEELSILTCRKLWRHIHRNMERNLFL